VRDCKALRPHPILRMEEEVREPKPLTCEPDWRARFGVCGFGTEDDPVVCVDAGIYSLGRITCGCNQGQAFTESSKNLFSLHRPQ
jgi:hypothetical protein